MNTLVYSGAGETSVTFESPGLTGTAADLTLAYLGPAPGKVGVDQANALGQWKGGPQGCRVPLSLALLQPQTENYGSPTAQIFAPFTSSQLVDVSIQRGAASARIRRRARWAWSRFRSVTLAT